MNEELRRRYVRDLIADLSQVGGAQLEKWIRPLWDHLAGGSVNARGLNPQGMPVAGALDATWPDGSVSEVSSRVDYFTSPYEKLHDDLTHVFHESSEVRTIRLFCNREAGPTASSYTDRLKRSYARDGYQVDIWDGRRIAEYIVDDLLIDDRFVTRVGDALPNLRRISEQNAANSRVPKIDIMYRGREREEEDILARLENSEYVVLFGFGGVGKTELACAVATRLRDEYTLVIWIDGERVERTEDLLAFDVRLNGTALNLLWLLCSTKTLLVMDNVGVDLDLEELSAHCGPGSRVLVTSRVGFGTSTVQVGFVSREGARQILSAGVADPCPEPVLDAVVGSVGGHPLTLRMLNRQAVELHDWDAVARECAHIVGAPDEHRQTVADRLLRWHLDVLGQELGFFAWCHSANVDSGAFEHIFGHQGLAKLQRWALTARGQSDAVRLHEIVYASVERLRHSLPVDSDDFERRFEHYITSQSSPKRLNFFRVVNRHRDHIRRLLGDSPRPGALRYAYLHGHAASKLDPALIGDPPSDATAGPIGDEKVWVLSIVEAIEADYRRVRDSGNRDAAQSVLEERLATFDRLISHEQVSARPRSIVRHHKAKSLLKLGRRQCALAIFEELVDEREVAYAARLQIARIVHDEPERAKALVFGIIEAEYRDPGTVPTSVLIETLGALRRNHLRISVSEMTESYGCFMAQQLKAAACSGEDQPIQVFAAIGNDWAYQAPELFMDVLYTIEVGTPQSAEDDDERIAIGRILTSAGKFLLRKGESVQARARFEQSIKFHSSVTQSSGFASTHYADALLRLGRYGEAARVLDGVRNRDREAFWLLRRSEAHLGENELQRAQACIDQALKLNLAERRSTFLAHRADVLFAIGNPDHEATLRDAIDNCTDGRYRDDLEQRLAQRIGISSK